MLKTKQTEPLKTKNCESCGEEFSCGAKSGKCWCFDVDLSGETLAKLREDFENCLCNDCLRQTRLEETKL